jgi:signal transduction histidine kinase
MPLPAQDGTPSSQVLVLTTDLTEKIQAEARARELALAQERSAFLDEFFTTLSHDLKTPLAIINTSLYLLERAETPDARAARIARIHEQVALVNKYIADLLLFSRLERLQPPEFYPVDFNALIDEVVELLRPRIEAKRISLTWTAQPGLPTVQGDRDQLVRLLINLIENAIIYTPEAGSVTVRLTFEPNMASLLLEVADTGIGIEPEALPRIFERFYRTDRAKAASGGGTGLGLAIVKRIVEAHGGTIAVDSAPGLGTRFSVLLATAPALAEVVRD